MQTRILEPEHFPWFDYKRYSFSLGLAVGDNCYLSGHTASAYDPERERMVVEGGMAEQARTAYAKVAVILEAGGKSLADVVRDRPRHAPVRRQAQLGGERRQAREDGNVQVDCVRSRSQIREGENGVSRLARAPEEIGEIGQWSDLVPA